LHFGLETAHGYSRLNFGKAAVGVIDDGIRYFDSRRSLCHEADNPLRYRYDIGVSYLDHEDARLASLLRKPSSNTLPLPHKEFIDE
jgi:hypothetical protein